MTGRSMSGPRRETPWDAPRPCKRCTGRGEAHYLTCPTLRLPAPEHDESCCMEPAWPGLGPHPDCPGTAALRRLTLLEASDVMNRRLADAAEAGLSVREAVAAWSRGERDVPP